MANVNNPYGLKPTMRTDGGGAPQTRLYQKLGSYAAALFKWDPVTEVAGYLQGPASGITVGTTRYRGVVLDPGAASKLTTHLVIDQPSALFDIQGDGADGTKLVVANMGLNANLLITTAGGGVTRDNSGAQLGEASVAVTSSLDVNVRQLLDVPDNAFGANARVEIRINKHLGNPEVTQT